MNTELIITANLGLLRAYRLVKGSNDRQPHLELVDEMRSEAAHQKVADQLSDRPGRFSKGGGPGDVPGDLSAGEQHGYQSEQRRRLTRILGDKISGLLADARATTCYLAASAPIRLQLVDQLAAPARAKVAKTLPLDLTKAEPAELLRRFQL